MDECNLIERAPAELVAAIPVARPVLLAPAPVAAAPPAPPAPSLPRTHPAAVVSAVCGFTAVIPIVCQVAGIGLGVFAIVRINRDRRNGVATGGMGLAVAGISVSALALAGWVMLAVLLAGVGSKFDQIDAGLGGVLG